MHFYSCKVAVVVTPTITGRSELERCLKSLEIAKKLSVCKEIKYFISEKTPREKFLKENIEEISKYDLVTFVEDSDYVDRNFFKIPLDFNSSVIYRVNCKELGIYWNSMGCDPMEVMATRFWGVSTPDDPLSNFHLWGYYFPIRYIKGLVEELLIPRPEIGGQYGEICYWAYILTNFSGDIREFRFPEYFHINYYDYPYLEITEEDLEHNLNAQKEIAKSICSENLIPSFEEYYGGWEGCQIFNSGDRKLSSIFDLLEMFRVTEYATDLEKKLLSSSFAPEDGFWLYSVRETEIFLNLLGSSLTEYFNEMPTEDDWYNFPFEDAFGED